MIITEIGSLSRKQGAIGRPVYGEAFEIWSRQCGLSLEKRELVGRDDFEIRKSARLVVVEAIGTECGHEVPDEVVDGAVARVNCM